MPVPVYAPNFAEFEALAREATVIPVYRRLTCDDLTPILAYARLRHPDGSFLFESVVGNERQGRYSFVGAQPFLHFSAKACSEDAFGQLRHELTIRTRNQSDQPLVKLVADPLRELEQQVALYRAPAIPGLPRFCCGAVGYAGYDVVRYQERLPNAPHDDRGLPDLSFAFYDQMVIFDHITKTMYVIALAQLSGGNLQAAYQAAKDQVDTLIDTLQTNQIRLPPEDIQSTSAKTILDRYHSNFAPGAYEEAVRKTKEYILAGDAFQVVLSQRFRTETAADALQIYRALRILNPSPFMFFVEGGPARLIGASPEIMCRVEQGQVVVRPLAGTRRRGESEEEDQQLMSELLADPKERAEHIMLVDLARNDVGRIAKLGSVAVTELMTVERYSHVMHISSTVVGELRPDLSSFDAMRAALPAGTLSGAPKVRAMQIIDELEPNRRGPYGGAIGYIDFRGNTDTCIALRTLVLCGNQADIQAGAGIVADSDPAAEHQETINKAMSLMRAIEVAEQQLSARPLG